MHFLLLLLLSILVCVGGIFFVFALLDHSTFLQPREDDSDLGVCVGSCAGIEVDVGEADPCRHFVAHGVGLENQLDPSFTQETQDFPHDIVDARNRS